MGILIKIRKYTEEKNNLFYKIFSLDGKYVATYLKITPEKNRIYFSATSDFKTIDASFDLSSKTEIIKPVADVPATIIIKLTMRILEALKTNNFPDILDYAA